MANARWDQKTRTKKPSSGSLVLVEQDPDNASAARADRGIFLEDLLGQFRNALASEAGLACDGASASNRITASLPAACALASDARGFFWKQRLPSAAPTSTTVLWTWGDAASPTTQFIEVAHTSGDALRIRIYGTTTSDYRETTFAGLVSSYGALRDVMFEFGSDSSGRDLRINGLDVTLTADTTAGTPPSNWQAALNSTVFALHGGLAYVFKKFWPANFRPSLTDAQDSFFIGGGVPERFKWASQVNRISNVARNSTGTAGATDWNFPNSGTTGNTATADGTQITLAAATNANGNRPSLTFSSFVSSTPTVGKYYAATVTVNAISGFSATLKGDVTDPTFISGINAPGTYRGGAVGITGNTVFFTFTGYTTGAQSISFTNLEFRQVGALFLLSPDESNEGGGFQIHDIGPLAVDCSLPTSGWSWTRPAPLGARTTMRGSFLHSAVSSSSGTTQLGVLPAGWSIVDFQANVDVAFDAATTLDLGTSASSARWVSALAISTTGLKAAPSPGTLQSFPQSASNTTNVYLKKNAATTTGDLLYVNATIERKY